MVVENNYEFIDDDNGRLFYAIDEVNGESSGIRMYIETEGEFMFTFARKNIIGGILDTNGDGKIDSNYDLIFNEVKKKCRYFDVIKVLQNNGERSDWVSYSCDDSEYKGNIGFLVEDGFGYIRHFK